MRRFFLITLVAVSVILTGVFLGDLLFQSFYQFPKNLQYGASFSPKFASELNLDWKEVYVRMLDELRVRNLRLPTYWDVLEPEDSKYDFSTTDFMLEEAQKRGAKVILTLGVRQYRWPECYIPDFAKKLSLVKRQKKILDFIKAVIDRYKSHVAIISWQVENEPLLGSFGEGCDKPERDFLKSEVELLRRLDKRPIILTDSGELGFWITSMRLSDVFGTTVYRTVYNKFFGFTDYPILPYLYNVKSYLVRTLFASYNQKTIIIELQAEPWSPNNNLVDKKVEEQASLLSIDKFKKNINFAKRTGFPQIYLWGVEWWYFMEKKGHPQYLDYAKILFKN